MRRFVCCLLVCADAAEDFALWDELDFTDPRVALRDEPDVARVERFFEVERAREREERMPGARRIGLVT